MNANQTDALISGCASSDESCESLLSNLANGHELDVTKRDRFELLSAYLDGEVSPEERRLVLTWLEEDPTTQCLYQRLLHLRQGLHTLYPTSWKSDSAQQTVDCVLDRVQQRFRLTCMAGFAAIALAVVGTFSGSLSNRTVGWLQANTPGSERDVLEIALDQPVVPIPKATVASENMMEEVLRKARPDGLENSSEL